MNGRLSVDQAPRSLLIRQGVDADATATRRSADTLAAAAEDPKVVDGDSAGVEANANANAGGEDLLIHHLINYLIQVGIVQTKSLANLGIFRLRCHRTDPSLYSRSQ